MKGLVVLCALLVLASTIDAKPFELGVSFSGGGIRATIGTLAAINQMLPDLQGIVPKVKRAGLYGVRPDDLTMIHALAATSGGSWGLGLQFINDRVTGKTSPGVISNVKAFLNKSKESWGPTGNVLDANSFRFNEEWSDRVCYSVYKPFEAQLNAQEAAAFRGQAKVAPAPPIPAPREKDTTNKMCTWLWQYRGVDQDIQANAKASGRSNYIAFNAYVVRDRHAVLPGQAAELRGKSDTETPDYFLRYNIATDQFETCEATDCLRPRPAEVFISKKGVTEKTLKVFSHDEAQWVLNPPSDMSKWQKLSTSRSGTILDLLGFASAAWTSNLIPKDVRASIALCAIRTADAPENVQPIILTDAGVFQNNPHNLLDQDIVVSFDFSDIKGRNTWAPEIKTPIDLTNGGRNDETEVVPVGKADPDVQFIVHRFQVNAAPKGQAVVPRERVVIQIPARFKDKVDAYNQFPTMVGPGGTVTNTYSLPMFNEYYTGLKVFYQNITKPLRERIAIEAGRIIAHREAEAKAGAAPGRF